MGGPMPTPDLSQYPDELLFAESNLLHLLDMQLFIF